MSFSIIDLIFPSGYPYTSLSPIFSRGRHDPLSRRSHKLVHSALWSFNPPMFSYPGTPPQSSPPPTMLQLPKRCFPRKRKVLLIPSRSPQDPFASPLLPPSKAFWISPLVSGLLPLRFLNRLLSLLGSLSWSPRSFPIRPFPYMDVQPNLICVFQFLTASPPVQSTSAWTGHVIP